MPAPVWEDSNFNRSYYEDVWSSRSIREPVVPDGRADHKPERQAVFEKRYGHIRSYEQYLFENSYRIVKIFLKCIEGEAERAFSGADRYAGKELKFSHS